MRSYAGLFRDFPLPPDTVQTMLMTGGSSAQAMGWQTSAASTAVDAPTAGAHIVRFTGMTSAGAVFGFMVNLVSTHAAVPTSGAVVTTGTTAGSTGNNIPIVGSGIFLIPSWSTGYSVAAFTSGYVIAEIWRK